MTGRTCETEAKLDALADGALETREREAVLLHVQACAKCARALGEIEEVKAAVAAMPALEPRPGDLVRALSRTRTGARTRTTLYRMAAAVVVAVGLAAGAVAILAPAGASLAYAPGLFVHYAHEPAPRAGSVLAPARWRPAPEGTTDLAAVHAGGARPLFTADLAFVMLARALAATDERLELEAIRPELKALAGELSAALERDGAAAGSAEAREAALLAADVVAVGRAIAGEAVPLSPRARAELDLVRRAAGIGTSPLSGAPEDYSTYGVARDPALLWFARSRLPLDRPETARAALALVHALCAPGPGGGRPIERYERIRARLAFFRGAPVDWPPERLLPELRRLFGARLTLAEVGADPDALGALAALDAPDILGPAGARPLFSLLGTRYDAASRATAALTGPGRLLGSGLDALAATGFPGAREQARNLDPVALERVARLLAPGRKDDDLYWLLEAARRELGPGDRALNLALVTLDPLALSAGPDWRPGAAAARAALAAPPPGAAEGAIDPCPEFFARLRSLARAVDAALGEQEPFPSRDDLRADLALLAGIFERLAAGDRALAARAGPLAAALASGPLAAAIPIDVVVRDGLPPVRHIRIVRGPIIVATDDGARGGALAALELPFERALTSEDAARLPSDLPLPRWLRSWRSP